MDAKLHLIMNLTILPKGISMLVITTSLEFTFLLNLA